MLLPDTISRLAFARAEQKIPSAPEPAPGANVPPPPPKPTNKPAPARRPMVMSPELSKLLKPDAGAELDFKIKIPSGSIAARG